MRTGRHVSVCGPPHADDLHDGAVFSHLLAPVVAFFERTGHKRVPRVAILVVVYVGVLALIVGAVISVGSRIAEQAASASR